MSFRKVRHLAFPAFCILHFAWLLSVRASAAPPAEPFRPSRLTTAPVVDGVLDDEAWQAATQASGFKTWRPDFRKDPSARTVVYATYDAENMYFAFRAYDAEPSRIKASMANRDTIRPDDWICIKLDSFNDQQSFYALYEKTRWDGIEDVRDPALREVRRGLFVKASYLWRL
jgi:hypothetical protein